MINRVLYFTALGLWTLNCLIFAIFSVSFLVAGDYNLAALCLINSVFSCVVCRLIKIGHKGGTNGAS